MAVYRTYTSEDRDNRKCETISVEKKQKVMTVLNNFLSYFKAKHL